MNLFNNLILIVVGVNVLVGFIVIKAVEYYRNN